MSIKTYANRIENFVKCSTIEDCKRVAFYFILRLELHKVLNAI